jgi:hypothetical protein
LSDYNIVDYGAVGDGVSLNTTAIQQAIDACSQNGGGRVVVPAGQFLTGTISLRDDIDFHMTPAATVIGSQKMADYPTLACASTARYGDRASPEDDGRYLGRALIFAQKCKNTAISGTGLIYGNVDDSEFDTGDAPKLHEYYRPMPIWFDECQDVVVKEVQIRKPMMWSVVFSASCNIHVNNIRVTEATFHNNDGCNFLDCRDAILEYCYFDTADDGVALKSFTPAGNRNCIIRNNTIQTRVNGIKLGTDSSGTTANILIENNAIIYSRRAAIAIQSVDGSEVADIRVVSNQVYDTTCPFMIRLGNRARKVFAGGNWITPAAGSIQGVLIKDYEVEMTKPYVRKVQAPGALCTDEPMVTSSISGFPGHCVQDVALENVCITVNNTPAINDEGEIPVEIPENERGYPKSVMFGQILPATGLWVRHVRNLRLVDVNIKVLNRDIRPTYYFDDVVELDASGAYSKVQDPKSTIITVADNHCSQ